MADKNLRARVTGLASQAVSNPVSRAAFGAAKGVTGVAVGAIRSRTGGGDQSSAPSETGDTGSDTGSDASLSTAQPSGAPAEDAIDSARSDDDETTGSDATSSEATGSSESPELLPYPDLEEPIPVVEEALAAEAENGTPAGGHATEPHASTRDEGHGDAQLQRAEQEEIAEEVAEAMPGGDLDLETPVGTTGADVGSNPDTAEADLQQPGTAPGVEPGLTSSVRKEEERGLSAAGGPDETS